MKFIQIHTLSSYSGVLLNRDDAGFAKRLPFGGATRTRVSSQCIKHHWRHFEGEDALSNIDAPKSVRSRRTFEKYIGAPLIEKGTPKHIVLGVVEALIGAVVGKADAKNPLRTGQLTVLGQPEISFLKVKAEEAIEKLKEEKSEWWEKDPTGEKTQEKALKDDIALVFKNIFNKEAQTNLKSLGLPAGLGAALFGRMVTSDQLSRTDAAIHVAHSFTVHAEQAESDYFSAVDELIADSGSGELGAGHINSTELTSGLFYHYTVVDVDLLISNLGGADIPERELASEIVKSVIKMATTVSPGAKLGSTAPYAVADCVLVECGDQQPRTLANAFLKPVSASPDLLKNTYEALASYIRDTDEMYGKNEDRVIAARQADGLRDALELEKRTVGQVADWVAQKVNEVN